MEKGTFKELIKKWKLCGHVYYNKGMWDRIDHFQKYCIPLLRGKRVVDIGCNAGAFSIAISEVAESYIGIEPGKCKIGEKHVDADYFKQTHISRRYIKNANVVFVNKSLEEYCEQEIGQLNAVVGNFVLYHLSDKEIKLLETLILPLCDVAIFQNRNSKRDTEKNSYKFWQYENISRWLRINGFPYINNIHHKSGDFTEVIGRK